MSIVGTQSVSMSDLMKLGPQALNQMAQGQMPSIAPSYMVIAALKALTDQQKAQQQPTPGGTVKDQVLAQATPPTQAGIGAMMPQQQPQQPVQGFAEGGPVGTAAINAQIYEFFRPWWERAKEETRRGLASRQRTLDEVNYSNEPIEPPRATQSTLPQATYSNEPIEPPGVSVTPRPAMPAVGGSASSSSRGIGGVGGNPLAKYEDYNVKRRALSEFSGPELPSAANLDAALAKYSKPNEERLAELRKSEKMAGLGAFAEGILQGRGLGGALGPAAAAASRAMEERADKRRAFEDRWEDIARDLGLKKDTAEYDRAKVKYESQVAQQTADVQDQTNRQRYGFDVTSARNREALDQQRLALQAEANRIAEQVRREGRNERNQAAIERLFMTARDLAIKEAENLFGDTKMDPNAVMIPQQRQMLEQRQVEKQRYIENATSRNINELNRRLSGAGAEAPASGGAQVAKDYTR